MVVLVHQVVVTVTDPAEALRKQCFDPSRWIGCCGELATDAGDPLVVVASVAVLQRGTCEGVGARFEIRTLPLRASRCYCRQAEVVRKASRAEVTFRLETE